MDRFNDDGRLRRSWPPHPAVVVEGVEVYAGRVGNNKYCDGVEKGRLHHPSGLDHLILASPLLS